MSDDIKFKLMDFIFKVFSYEVDFDWLPSVRRPIHFQHPNTEGYIWMNFLRMFRGSDEERRKSNLRDLAERSL
jgi:hypothetical protein